MKITPTPLTILAINFLTIIVSYTIFFENWVSVVLMLLMLVILVVFATKIILALFSTNVRRATSYVFPLLLMALIGLFGGDLLMYAEQVKIAIFDSRYRTCSSNSVSWAMDKRFAICDYHYNSYFGEAEAIIYDSSGEVLLPSGRQSREWKNFISNIKGVSFGEGEYVAVRVVNGYYYVYFNFGG